MSKIDQSLFAAGDRASEQAFGNCPTCEAALAIRHGKSGPFLGCVTYPKCDFTKPLKEYENADLKVIEGSSCPLCEHELVIKKGRYGMFIGCSDFPQCHYIQTDDKAEDTQVACPSCKSGQLKKRANKFGKSFFACNAYPSCKYLLNLPPVAETCPDCGWGILQKRNSNEGQIVSCPQKNCGYSRIVDS